jgi:hypothetical protein
MKLSKNLSGLFFCPLAGCSSSSSIKYCISKEAVYRIIIIATGFLRIRRRFKILLEPI